MKVKASSKHAREKKVETRKLNTFIDEKGMTRVVRASTEKWGTSDELCARMAEQLGGKCILSFSRGKDSVAAWIQLKRFFTTVYPVYLYRVPGIKFEERSIEYFEQVFGCRIAQYPHPWLYNALVGGYMSTPGRNSILNLCELPTLDYDDVFNAVRLDMLDNDLYVADGVRAFDNPKRMANFAKQGPVNKARQMFSPCFDWSFSRVFDEIKASGIKLPVDYHWFGRSFDGLSDRYLIPLMENAPDDYERVKAWFPLVESNIVRRQFYGLPKFIG